MARKKKNAEAAAVEPVGVLFAPGEEPIEVPPGNPLEWPIADWLAASQIPVDAITAALAEAAARHGAAGIPLKVLQRIWMEHTSTAQRERAILSVLVGLVAVVQTGKGPVGHAGVEMA